MIITDLYKIKISTSQTNVNIDDIIDVYIQLYDFNLNLLSDILSLIPWDYWASHIRNKTLQISCDKGVLCDEWGEPIIDNVYNFDFLDIENNGTIHLTYHASDWGLCTFSCDAWKHQIFVQGAKEIVNFSGNSFYVDEAQRLCLLYYTLPSNLTLTTSATTIDDISSVIEGYEPIGNVYASIYRGDIVVRLLTTGIIDARTSAETGTANPVSTQVIFQWRY